MTEFERRLNSKIAFDGLVDHQELLNEDPEDPDDDEFSRAGYRRPGTPDNIPYEPDDTDDIDPSEIVDYFPEVGNDTDEDRFKSYYAKIANGWHENTIPLYLLPEKTKYFGILRTRLPNPTIWLDLYIVIPLLYHAGETIAIVNGDRSARLPYIFTLMANVACDYRKYADSRLANLQRITDRHYAKTWTDFLRENASSSKYSITNNMREAVIKMRAANKALVNKLGHRAIQNSGMRYKPEHESWFTRMFNKYLKPSSQPRQKRIIKGPTSVSLDDMEGLEINEPEALRGLGRPNPNVGNEEEL